MVETPRISGKELIKILKKKLNFEVIRIKGSHHFLRNSKNQATVIPVHGNETLGIGLINKIRKDIEFSKEEFFNLIKG